MFKLGRGSGGGRGSVKRPSHAPSPAGRAAPSRFSFPSDRGRGAAPQDLSSSANAREESFEMVSHDHLEFASIIRLAPDLVEEILCAESRGATVRIKFDSNPNDASGNLLDVDGKEFKFTWSRDSGDLCNMYEECRNGEDGNGLLVERGSAWRKLNVQRTLDESLKNHVKMRSEEAERRYKSRKAIVLDPANPSVKNQSTAAIEGNTWKNWNKKRLPPSKKQKVEANQGALKQTLKMASSKNTRSGYSASPQPSLSEKPAVDSLASPFGTGNTASKYVSMVDIGNAAEIVKDDAFSPDNEPNNKGALKVSNKSVWHKDVINLQCTDLRSLLISLLTRSPEGMSLKAIEKAVGEVSESSSKNIKIVLRSIANFQAPGRYILKPGVEVNDNGRILSENQSSPDQEVAREENASPDPEPIENPTIEDFKTEIDICSFDESAEKSNEQQVSPNTVTNEAKVNHESDGKADTTSGSGSDSDSESDSSDSGSGSGSGGQSASNSDSESDGSSSSKGTDVEVNITTSDDEQDGMDKKSFAAKLKSSDVPGVWNSDELHNQALGDDMHNQAFGQDDILTNPQLSPFPERNFDVAQSVENTQNMLLNDTLMSSEDRKIDVEENVGSVDREGNLDQFDGQISVLLNQKHLRSEHVDLQGSEKGTQEKNMIYGRDKPNGPNDASDHEQTHFSERTKSKTKRPTESDNVDEKAKGPKRAKPVGLGLSLPTRSSKECNISKLQVVSEKSQGSRLLDGVKLTVNMDCIENDELQENGSIEPETQNSYLYNHRKGNGQDFPNGLGLNTFESGRVSDYNGKKKSFSTDKSAEWAEKSNSVAKHGEMSSEENFDNSASKYYPHKDNRFIGKDKLNGEKRDENSEFVEKHCYGSRGSSLEGRQSFHEPIHKKSSEQAQKDDFMTPTMQKPSIDRTGAGGKSMILQREPSELELGELREPSTELLHGNKVNLERKVSENKVNIDDAFLQDSIKQKNASDVACESKQTPISENRKRSKQEMRRRTSEFSAKPQHQTLPVQSHLSQRPKQADFDIRSHVDRHPEPSRRGESRGSQNRNFVSSNATLDESSRHVRELVLQKDSRYMAECLQQTDHESNVKDKETNGSSKDADSNGERIEASEDGAILFFSKFEKDEPDRRGPIKDYSQYREYVEEFEEKYQCYLSLNESMEKTRAEFFKIWGNFPDHAKGNDDKKDYEDCCRRISNFCSLHIKKDRRIKKMFIVLHEELKILKQRIKEFATEYSKD